MAGTEEDCLDFTQLEKELNASIVADARYWRENDAKFRAVEQKVATYEEFRCVASIAKVRETVTMFSTDRDIVRASHLKPLDKADKASLQNKGKNSIWNSLAPKKKQYQSTAEADATFHQQCSSVSNDGDRLPATSHEFAQYWVTLEISERLDLLHRMGPATLGHLFRNEIPVGVLGEILQALLAFTPSTAEIVLVIGILEALTEAKRFGLSLQFLSSVEQTTCRRLMEKLESSMQDRQQDLAEEDVTEWTLQELRKKYQV